MKKLLTCFGLFILAACSHEELFKGHIIDVNYPTTYHQLPDNDLASLRSEYLQDKDSCFRSSLNNYGFCSYRTDYYPDCNTNCQSFARQRARLLALDFLQKNKRFNGIDDISKVKIEYYSPIGGGYQCGKSDSVLWKITTENQHIKNMEVLGTEIFLIINSNGVLKAEGNWYPVIYISEKEVISYEMAKVSLWGKHFDFLCWSNVHLEITKDTKWEEPVKRKLICPFPRNDSIELHVVWVLQTGVFQFYIDVMTGEMIVARMTVIC